MNTIEILTAIGVFVVCLTFFYQTWPHLRESTNTDNSGVKGRFTISVKNTGNGIAKVKSFRINAYGFDTESLSNDDFIDNMARPIDMNGKPDIEVNIWEKGDAIESGEELIVFEAKIPKDNNNLQKTFDSLANNVSATGKYRSIIGVPYKLNTRGR